MASAQNLPADANANLDQLSFRDKMKFFEKEIKAKSDTQPSKAPAKQFSYLAEHEIAKLKQEEATKTANMSSEQLRSYVASGVADMRPDHDLDHVLSSLNTRSGPVRTLKAENRQQNHPPSVEGRAPISRFDDDDEEELGFSPSDLREQEAQKRAAWRKARMKSLETDAVHAQAVIAKAQELSRAPASQGSKLSAVDIAFADDGDHQSSLNGSSQSH